MSAVRSQFNLSVENYAERARLVTDLRDGCARAERGERVDLHQITEKLKGLVQALNNDLIAMGKTNVSRKLHNEIQAHKKIITGLTARVKVLSAKKNLFPAWVKPVGLTVLAVGGGLALTAIAASRFASSPDASYTGVSYEGSYGGEGASLNSADLTWGVKNPNFPVSKARVGNNSDLVTVQLTSLLQRASERVLALPAGPKIGISSNEEIRKNPDILDTTDLTNAALNHSVTQTNSLSVDPAITSDTLERVADAADGRFEADRKPGQAVNQDPLNVAGLNGATQGEGQNFYSKFDVSEALSNAFKTFVKFVEGSNERARAAASYFAEPLGNAMSALQKGILEDPEPIIKYGLALLGLLGATVVTIRFFAERSRRLDRLESNLELYLTEYFNRIRNLPPIPEHVKRLYWEAPFDEIKNRPDLQYELKRLIEHNNMMQAFQLKQAKNYNFDECQAVIKLCKRAGLSYGYLMP